MNDRTQGTVEGLMIGLLVSEKNKKHPQRIYGKITKILQNISRDLAPTAISDIGLQYRACNH